LKPRLLVIDDESGMLSMLSLFFKKEGYEVTTAGSATEGRETASERNYDLVLCDILMPDGNGLDLLREIKAEQPETPVIMMTAYDSNRSAVEAMKIGAAHYITKPFDLDELKILTTRVLETRGLETENLRLKRELEQRYRFKNIIGRGPKMREIFDVIERVAKTHSTVLVRGESGTGKELIARAIHYESPRSEHRFLSINCGALPENLLESELFGHERGAFTGAVREKKGLFQEAHRGTLFLDEIGEMTPSMQVKLLRVLQERRVRRVGGNEEEAVDVRIIAATNQDLQARIEAGDFREDLYYRIDVIPIVLPPLRDRPEDVPLLTEHFNEKFSGEMGLELKSISKEALRCLVEYDWPGNVRELENTIERALALATRDELTPDDLPRHVVDRGAERPDVIALPEGGLDLEHYLDEIRSQLMRQALDRAEGVQTQAAELLGMSFRSFRYYAKKLDLTS